MVLNVRAHTKKIKQLVPLAGPGLPLNVIAEVKPIYKQLSTNEFPIWIDPK